MDVLHAAWVIAYREVVRFRRERARWIGSFAWPLMFLLVFGAGLNRVVVLPGFGGGAYLKFLYPGIVSMTVVMTGIFSGLSVVWDREFGFLKEVLVAPLSRTGVVLGKACGATLVALLQSVLLLLAAPALGIRLDPLRVALLFPTIAVLTLSVAGLGILLAARMRSQQGFQVLMQTVVFPLVFVSGVFYPVNDLPGWLAALVRLDPVTYGVDAVRRLMVPAPPLLLFGHPLGLGVEILIVGLLGGILLGGAAWSFSRPS